jgi:hypothetical protein
MSHKRTNGERMGNIQFGYRLCSDGKHVEPDRAEQAVLDEIRRLRRSGATLRGIAAALNHRGHRTRRGSAWRAQRPANPESSCRVSPWVSCSDAPVIQKIYGDSSANASELARFRNATAVKLADKC